MFIPSLKTTTKQRLKALERNTGSARYKTWRNRVLERDDHKCQWPGCKHTTQLEVHHIHRYADNIALRYNVYNGVTLCKEHHKGIQGKERFYARNFVASIMARDATANKVREELLGSDEDNQGH